MKTKLLVFICSFNFLFIYSQESFSVENIEIIDVKRTDKKLYESKSENDIYSTPLSTTVKASGVTKGTLSVSQTGGAIYDVPISVPPGINGVEPDISLTYNSQNNSGIAGYGWNISGVSVITRIPAVEYYDGFVDPVDLDGNDRFSLDGQRLLLKNGDYGEDGAIYQTKNYSNVKIESYGNYYDGPGYFKVSYPDGSFAYYGKTSNSRTRIDYAITYWQNPQGVSVSYKYIKTNNSLSISEIRYGSRFRGSQINKILFKYRQRNRPIQSYIGGVSFERRNILSEIKVFGNGKGYRNYEITHSQNKLGYQKIVRITEKNGDNTLGRNPILFDYNTTSSAVNSIEVIAELNLHNIEQRNSVIVPLDLDGSGTMDFVLYPKSMADRDYFILFKSLEYNNNSGISFQAYRINLNYNFVNIFPTSIVTHNNKKLSGQSIAVVQSLVSGKTSFKVYSHSPSTVLTSQYTKTWTAPTYINEFSCEDYNTSYDITISQKYLSGDFNGDGLTDVMAFGKKYTKTTCYPVLARPGEPCGFSLPFLNNKYKISNDTIVGPKQKYGTKPMNIPIPNDCCRCVTKTVNAPQVHFIDLNRNKTIDFSSSVGSLSYNGDRGDLYTGDVNGDGKTDVIHVTSGSIMVYSLNDSNNLIRLFDINHLHIDSDLPALLGDYNGDGKMDLMFPKEDNSSYFTTYLSTGNSFEVHTSNYPFEYQKTTFNSGEEKLNGYALIPVDVNMDGSTDIVDYRTITYNSNPKGSQSVEVFTNTSSYPYFEQSNYVKMRGNLKHFPIPIFFPSNKKNNKKLRIASISDNKITAFVFQKNNKEDMLLRSVQRNGIRTSITYHSLFPDTRSSNNSSIYQEDYREIYPYADVKFANSLKIVTQLKQTGGSLKTLWKDYSYYGATVNYNGIGFMGFKGMATTNWYNDLNNRIFEVTKYDPHIGGAVKMKYSTVNFYRFYKNPVLDNFISLTSYYYDKTTLPNKVLKLKLTGSVTQNLLTGTITNKSFDYNNYMLPTKKIVKSGNGIKKVEVAYERSLSGRLYYIGRPKSKTITMTLGAESFVSEELYSYQYNLLNQKKTRGDGTDYLIENFVYDSFGNIVKKTIAPSGEIPRTFEFKYDDSGRFLIQKTGIKGLQTTYEYNLYNGNLLKETNPFGLETSYVYDEWQRLVETTDYLGNTTKTTYTKKNNKTIVTTLMDNGGSKISIYDSLGRIIHTKEKNVLEQWVEKMFEYDPLGRLIRESQPFIGVVSKWNEKEYDLYGRLIQLKLFTGKVVDISYNGLKKTVSDGVKTTTTTKDAWGNIIKKQDPGGIIDYTYYANGNLKSANYKNNIIQIEQDGWGRKIKLIDSSAGTYTYAYNGFGQMVTQTNPNGEINYTYDAVGKLIKKEINGKSTGKRILYSYNNNTQTLRSISLTNNTGNLNTYIYDYDSYNRPISVKENTPYAQFTKKYYYNSFGKVQFEKYAATDIGSSKSIDKKIEYIYQNGELLKIVDAATSNILWQITDVNANGQKLSVKLGGAMQRKYTYDAFGYLTGIKSLKKSSGVFAPIMELDYDFDARRGNLKSRSNSLFNWHETYTYDGLDRLIGYKDNNGIHSQNYDALGRIQSNSQLGVYGYSKNTYKQTSLSLNTSGAAYFDNLQTQQISYNALNNPIEIIEAGRDKVSFEYNAFGGRSNMFYGDLQTDKTKRRYSKHYSYDGSMEFTYDKETGTTTFIAYIGGSAYSSPVIWHSKQDATGTNNHYYYLHRDYLGSILAITDANGDIKEKRHFDAWGNIIKLADGNGNALSSFKILDRGYTGHEHLQGVHIIHMNGRLYDPLLRRFLSPDNFVQNPYNTQNFNRYGYVLNNPLKYTDSSGEIAEWLFFGIAGVIWAVNAIFGDHDATPHQDISSPDTNSQIPGYGLNNPASSTASTSSSGTWVEGYEFEQPHGIKINTWLPNVNNSAIASSMAVGKEKDSGWLGYLQTGLDVVGLIPGIGEIADGVNALIYLAKGDYANAALSGAAMIPFVGWGATGTKLAIKANKAFDLLGGLRRAAKGGASLGAGRTGVKQWLQNAGNLERGQLIKDIEGAGFKKVFDGKGMMHFERGGMKIRLDPPQPGTPFNHMHLNYGGNKSAYDIFLNPVNYKSPAAHIPIR